MLRSLGRVVGSPPRSLFRWLGRSARARPRVTVAVLAAALLVLLVGAALGAMWYGRHQLRAAEAAIKEGRASEARVRLGFCLSVWPRDAETHLTAARAARMTGDYAAAEDHLNRCIKLQGRATESVQLEFLLMRAQTGEVDEVANDLFALVGAGHPDRLMILETIARAYMQLLRYGPAYACLNRWIEEDPGSAQAYFWRGWVAERLNNAKAAMADYEKALELEPDRLQVRLRIAEMLLEDHKPLEAVPHLELLRERHPDRADVAARLGQCRFLQGRSAEARQLLEEAVKQMPDDPAVLIHLAKLDVEAGHPAEAEVRLRHALKVDPSDTEAQYTLVTALQAQNRDAEARTVMEHYEATKALLERANHLLQEEARHPTRDAKAASDIGVLLLQIGQERQGLYWLDQALLRDPRNQPAHRALAEYYDRKGEPDRAAEHRRQLRDSAGTPPP